jgi:hypothetical protein
MLGYWSQMTLAAKNEQVRKNPYNWSQETYGFELRSAEDPSAREN